MIPKMKMPSSFVAVRAAKAIAKIICREGQSEPAEGVCKLVAPARD